MIRSISSCFKLAIALLLEVSIAHAAEPTTKPSPLLPGLIATYSAADRKVSMIAFSPAFALRERDSVHPQLASDFLAVWEGFIQIESGGRYTFHGDGKIRIDGQDVGGKPTQLAAGEHAIRISYIREGGPVRYQMEWESGSFSREPVPPQILFHRGASKELTEQIRIDTGRLLVEELTCVTCHDQRNLQIKKRKGPDLSRIGSRTNAAWIVKWLENPAHFRPKALMPIVSLSPSERQDIAAFLMTLVDPKPVSSAPPPDAAVIKQGKQLFESVGCLACHAKDGLTLSGLGSKTNHTALTQYLLDPLKVDPSGRMPGMLLQRDEAAAISAYLIQDRNPEFETKVDGGDEKKGRQFAQDYGCVDCHTIAPVGSAALQTNSPLPARVDRMALNRGCVSDNPPRSSPRFNFTPADRQNILAFLNSIQAKADVAQAPLWDLSQNMRRFACTACHPTGGASPTQNFQLVPPLTGTAGKLKSDWLNAVLIDRKRIRPWVHARMPDFGLAISGMAGQFEATATAPPPTQRPPSNPQQINLGRTLVGLTKDGLGCVRCHSFGGSDVPAEASKRGPDLVGMADRIRPDWFERWLRQPNHIQPGTPMPARFADKSDAQASAQIAAIWAYLSQGKAMLPPDGIGGAK